ncbi:MAG: amidase [Chloroflexota bacterium]
MLIKPAPLANTIQHLRSGKQDLVSYIDDMLDHLDQAEPQIEALIPENNRRDRLKQEAEALQKQYPTPESRPPLYGILLGVKDVYRVDGFPTGAGSSLPSDLFTGPEAACVTPLREAGALILGKTVTTEFAYFAPGPTRNPHNLAHTPGGSSSGSAAAVAAGFCQLAIGTQTIGSVIRPAAFCGIVGFKPSFGRINADGVIYVSKSFDHVGLFTQDIAGMVEAAAILCRDWQSEQVNNQPTKKPVLGVPDGPYLAQTSSEGLADFEAQVIHLQSAGYIVKRVPTLADIVDLNHRHRQLMAAEMAQEHRDWYTPYKDIYRSQTLDLIETGQTVSAAQMQTTRDQQIPLRQALEAQMTDNGLDLWVCPPALGTAPEGINATGDPTMNLPWTNTGLPTVSVPAGRAANGLPLGLQCVAKFNHDEQLLGWAEPLAKTLQTRL